MVPGAVNMVIKLPKSRHLSGLDQSGTVARIRGRSLTHAPQQDVRGKNPTEFVQLGCYQPCVLKRSVRGGIPGRPFPLGGVVGGNVGLMTPGFGKFDLHSRSPHERLDMICASVVSS
jgi:hypothetical protein